jgi:hypothetical protein
LVHRPLPVRRLGRLAEEVLSAGRGVTAVVGPLSPVTEAADVPATIAGPRDGEEVGAQWRRHPSDACGGWVGLVTVALPTTGGVVMRARSRAALFVTVLAAVAWSLVPAAPAVAAAGITITGLSVVLDPNEARVDGTATCSTTTGTAAVFVQVSQDFPGFKPSGVGSTTVSCADQPAHWSVHVTVFSLCTLPSGPGCVLPEFLPNSTADAAAWLRRNGVQEAIYSGEYPT